MGKTDVNIRITADAKDAQGAIRTVRRDVDDLSGAAGRNQGASSALRAEYSRLIKSATLVASAFVAMGAAMAARKVLQATMVQEAAVAQLTAALKSTAGAAQLSASALTSLAAQLQTVTTYGDESIIAMEALLLTFKNIKGDNFNRATRDILDMATAMKMDLKSAAVMVGKALNDPTEGLTAMSRAGVTFSDSQKDVIKKLQESGDMAAAQVLIMKELESQFGGSAEAARDTLAGALQALKNAFGDLFEGQGNLEQVRTEIEKLTTLLTDPQIVTGIQNFAMAVIDGMGKAAEVLANFGNAYALFRAFQEDKISLTEWIGAGPEKARALLQRVAEVDTALVQLTNQVKKLEQSKAGDFWWTAAEEQEYQQAKQALENYKQHLADIKELKSASLHSAAMSTIASTVSAEEERGIDLEELQAANRKRYANEIELAEQITDLWRITAAEKYEIEARSVARLMELNQKKYAQEIKVGQQMQDVWLQNIAERAAAADRAVDYAIAAEKSAIDEINDAWSDLDISSGFGDFSDPLTDGIGKAITAMGRLIDAYGEQRQALEAIEKQRIRINALDDTEERAAQLKKLAQTEQDVADASIQAQLSGYRELFGTTSQLFDENSKERKALHQAELAFAAIETAVGLQKAVVNAIASVTAQGQGDPYTAFARVAAMAAMMGGILSQIGGTISGGGSGSVPVAGSFAAGGAGGTGLVLGDATAGSTSLSDANEFLQEINAKQYSELQAITAELEDLNYNLTGLASSMVRAYGSFSAGELNIAIPADKLNFDVGKYWESIERVLDPITSTIEDVAGALGGVFADISDAATGWFGDALSKLSEWVFGSTKSALSESGVALNPTSIGSLYAGGDMAAEQYAKIRTVKDNLWSSKKVSYSEQFAPLDVATQDLFNDMFQGLSRTIVTLAEGLGGDVEAAMAYVFDIGNIDLKDLSGDEIAEKMAEVFSYAGDVAANSIFNDLLMTYQQINEGPLETIVRLMAEKFVVLDILGKTSMDTSGDVIALTQSIIGMAGGLETLQENFATYYENFFSEAEQMDATITRLVGTLGDLGLTVPQTRDEFRALVESVDLTGEQLTGLLAISGEAAGVFDYLESQLEEAASAAAAIADERAGLERQLLELQGDTVALRNLERAALDASNRALYDNITALQDQAAAAQAAAVVAQQRAGLESQILTLIGDTDTLRARELESIDPENRAMQEGIWQLEDLIAAEAAAAAAATAAATARREALTEAYAAEIETLNDRLNAAKDIVSEFAAATDRLASAKKQMVLQDESWTASQYRTAQDLLTEVLRQARTGDFSGLATADSAIDTLTGISPDAYTSKADYQRNYWKTYNTLSSLENLTKDQATEAEQTVALLQQQIDTASSYHTDSMAAFDAQISATGGISAAVAALAAALLNQANAAPITPPAAPITPPSDSDILTYVNTAMGAHSLADDAFRDIYQAAVSSGVSSARLASVLNPVTGTTQQDILAWVDSVGLPRFATGGITSGPSLAGEAGVEAVVPLPNGRSIPVQMTGSGDAKTLAEIRALLQDLVTVTKATGGTQVKAQKRLVNIIEDWDANGQPEERVA
jgi:hypothetical protein